MRSVVIGRKNWLFVGTPEAGRRAAVLMSLFASCKETHIEPWAYLRSAIESMSREADLESLLPDRWLRANPAHR